MRLPTVFRQALCGSSREGQSRERNRQSEIEVDSKITCSRSTYHMHMIYVSRRAHPGQTQPGAHNNKKNTHKMNKLILMIIVIMIMLLLINKLSSDDDHNNNDNDNNYRAPGSTAARVKRPRVAKAHGANRESRTFTMARGEISESIIVNIMCMYVHIYIYIYMHKCTPLHTYIFSVCA